MKRYKDTDLFITKEGKVFGPRGERKVFDNGAGYKQITYLENGKMKAKTVHRMVAEVYLGESDLEVNHIDCDKNNNNISNLEYVTRKENMRHAVNNKLLKNRDMSGNKNPNNKITSKTMNEIRKKYNNGVTQLELSKQYGVHKMTINRRLKEKV